MSTRISRLAFAAVAVVAASTAMPSNASAFGHGHSIAAPVRVITSAPSVRWGRGYGWGYGRGWCYWHPYVCYRNR
jgi:hypothetical protein